MVNSLSTPEINSILDVSVNTSSSRDLRTISLSANEIANLLLQISHLISDENTIDDIIENTIRMIGESGIADNVLFFQSLEGNPKSILTHFWSSPYFSGYNPVGAEINFESIPTFKFVSSKDTFQINSLETILSLPNYIFKNKYKAFFLRLKSKSMLVSNGSKKQNKISIMLISSSCDLVWSNEIEKLLQAIVDHIGIAANENLKRIKIEDLQRNVIKIQEKALKEKEDLLREFAGNIHDLPCSIIPSIKEALRRKDFDLCEKLVDDLYGDLRQLINEYIVPDLELLDFGSNLYQLLNGVKKTFKGVIDISIIEDEIYLDKKAALEILKVLKEWFCNIEKHSCAGLVSFKFEVAQNKNYRIIISDNGKGFDVNDVINIGYGILNIKKRLSDIGAIYDISSINSVGSTLTIQIPIKEVSP